MAPVTPDLPIPHRTWTRLRRAGGDLAIGLPLLLAAAGTTRWLFDLPATYLFQSVALYALLAALILWHVPAVLAGREMGAANRVTLGRATLLLPVAALVWQPEILSDAGSWWIIALSTVAMMLDGVDGWMARRSNTTTDFGGRFDMELDAFLVLALSVLVWLGGRVGFWVICIGALRYLFVAAGWFWPALQTALPHSRRRKIICVVQGVGLLVCLGPIIPSAMVTAVAGGVLVLLIYSFAADVRWLVRKTGGHGKKAEAF